jgi:hypothetical protein
MGTCIIQRGDEGSGKSYFTETIAALISGRDNLANGYYFKIANPEHLTGKFNDVLVEVILAQVEEAVFAGDHQASRIVREIITGRTNVYEKKHGAKWLAQSYTRLIFNGNAKWLIQAALHSRRFLVLDTSDKYMNNVEFFAKLERWIYKENGLEALMYFFLHFDYSKINFRSAPVTSALMEQRSESMDLEDKWFYNMLNNGRISAEEIVNDQPKVDRNVMYNNFIHVTNKVVKGGNRSLETQFGNKLRAFLPLVNEFGIIIKGGMGKPLSEIGDCKDRNDRRMYVLPTLKRCRELFELYVGHELYWDPSVDKWEKEANPNDLFS